MLVKDKEVLRKINKFDQLLHKLNAVQLDYYSASFIINELQPAFDEIKELFVDYSFLINFVHDRGNELGKLLNDYEEQYDSWDDDKCMSAYEVTDRLEEIYKKFEELLRPENWKQETRLYQEFIGDESRF